MFAINYAEGVSEDLSQLRKFDRQHILDRIDEQLVHQPDQPTRNKKMLPGFVPPWEHEPPVWELRVGDYRVYYDVDLDSTCVTVRAIRRKPPHQTTEQTV